MKLLIALLCLLCSTVSADIHSPCNTKQASQCIKNIKKISTPLNLLNKINGYEHIDFKTNKTTLILVPNDVAKVYPSLISYSPTGEQLIDTHALTVLIIESIKELQSINEKLQQHILKLNSCTYRVENHELIL